MGCPEQVNEFILREAPARADFNPFSEWLTDEGWAIIQVTPSSKPWTLNPQPFSA